MLALFEAEGIRATWATVGMLYAQDEQDLQGFIPREQPAYTNQKLSAYAYLQQGLPAGGDLHFAPDLVKQIQEAAGQDLGTHTFAHYYCLEAGQTVETFEADLAAVKQVANRLGHVPETLVFPRNQFNTDYLQACQRAGIRAVRTNPTDWWWSEASLQKEDIKVKLARTADAYLPLSKGTAYAWEAIQNEAGVYLMPASRFLRPRHLRYDWLNKLRIQRIKQEMTAAAQKGYIYHLWWHPHNFGWTPAESMAELRGLIAHYQSLAQSYGMQSLHMLDMAEQLDQMHAKA